MKKIAVPLLCLSMLCAFLASSEAAAAEAAAVPDNNSGQAVINTEVPALHNVTVKLVGSGSFELDGKSGSVFQVDRLSEPMLKISPDSDWELTSLTVNGTEVTDKIADLSYTFEPVYEDKEAVITLTRSESIPDSGPPDSSEDEPSTPESSSPDSQGGSGNPATGVIGSVSIGTAILIGALSVIRYRNKDNQ